MSGKDGQTTGLDVLSDPLGGVNVLSKVDIFNMLCLPTRPESPYDPATLSAIAAICAKRRAMLLIDPPAGWGSPTAPATVTEQQVEGALALSGADKKNGAVYYPWLQVRDPQTSTVTTQGPCGAIAGLWAATDTARGVWKAPAGTQAAIGGIVGLTHVLDDENDIGVLNPLGVNCLRVVPLVGPALWGARTTDGADGNTSPWKYIPVRRTALFIEESLRRGTQWVVFEPNDEPLWGSIRLNVGAFMNPLYRQGAFQGATPAEAYVVKCDKDNNPQNDIDRGIVNITVGFAPLNPAEFVVIHIQQLAGQIQV